MCQTLTTWVTNKQCRQHKGACHLNVLRGKQHLSPVHPVAKTPPTRENRMMGVCPRNRSKPR